MALLLLLLQDPPSLGKDDRVVAAFYDASGTSAAAHRRELEAMARSEVDVALVAAASAPLLEALDAIDKDRRARPWLGLRLDAARLKDLRAVEPAIRDFVRSVAPHRRARVDGRTVLWLDPAPEAEPAAWEGLLERLRPEVPFVIAEAPRKADRTYVTGGSREQAVAVVGPGGEREDGRIYERSWAVAARPGPAWIALEAWSGTAGVCECKEHGKKYAEITRRNARAFKQGEPVPMPRGKWTGAAKGVYTLEYNPNDQGLRPVKTPEGPFETIAMAGVTVLTSREAKKGAPRHLCFDVDDSLCWWEKKSWRVTVDFLDTGEGAFRLEYDSADRALEEGARAVKSAGERRFSGTGEWRRETFDLPDARFSNGQPGGGDFRIVVEKRGIALRLVAVAPP